MPKKSKQADFTRKWMFDYQAKVLFYVHGVGPRLLMAHCAAESGAEHELAYYGGGAQ